MSETKVHTRPFGGDADFWRIREMVIESYPDCGPGWNWDLRRWDGARFYNPQGALNPNWTRSIHLWEDEAGKLLGAVNGDGPGLFFLQIRPSARGLVEEAMLDWAEDNLAASEPRRVETEVFCYDRPRERILERRGYHPLPEGGSHRKLRLRGQALPAAKEEPGYIMRPLRGGDPADCQRLADLLNAAFHRTFHNGGEFFQFARLAPCYREDLHLVMQAPDGSLAAHVAAIYDPANQRGLFEPVCTHPGHQRKGLAYALMLECLKRLQALGALEVTVETGDMEPANGLYDAFGFNEYYRCQTWRKDD